HADTPVITPPEANPSARSWFDPREGLAIMRWPLDYAIATGLGIVSFVLSYVGYTRVSEKIFDEIYFARAAEEYLKHWYIYENTHPPLTKLLITLSVSLFGGLAHGDNAAGWRFLDLVFGALMVVMLYVLAKRITRSTLFASLAAVLLCADGMHFVQSRIATPESFVGFFALATLYTFYRYWIGSQVRTAQEVDRTQRRYRIYGVAGCLALAIAIVAARFWNETNQGQSAAFVVIAKIVAVIYLFSGLYLLFRGVLLPRFVRSARSFTSYPDGSTVKTGENRLLIEAPDGGTFDSARAPVGGDLSVNVRGTLVLTDDELTASYRKDGSLEYATPFRSARFTPGGTTVDGESVEFGNPRLWLLLFAVSITCLVTSKWYGIMAYPATLGIIAFVWAQPRISRLLKDYTGRARRPARWGNPFGFPLDVVLSTIVFVGGSIYFAAYTPQFIGLKDTPAAAARAYTFSDVITMQKDMYMYHSTLKATHPYASAWWQWPLDLRPIAYYWKDSRPPAQSGNQKACCVAEITSLPNPVILWFGLFAVPFVGVLAYREKNKGYMLLVTAYLLQWLPWMRSPRISFAYHFYVDIGIICLCNAIVLQRLWAWGKADSGRRRPSQAAVFGYVALAVGAFAFFYPLLAGVALPWDQWNIRTLPWLMQAGWV
ncbi:MAG: phospholipid carrier-dependent glycosyltransferase, partial [Candidatus Eremiobacteraeota bacterium]|nr:phospholipid carrier-dependent glycosyltransferase [Candidatus Eremiobacteraeota bacterium]